MIQFLITVLFIFSAAPAAEFQPVKRCKRLSASGYFVPIPDCSFGNIHYNEFGVRESAAKKTAGEVLILMFGGGYIAGEDQTRGPSVAVQIETRLAQLTGQRVRLIDASYPQFHLGEPEFDVEGIIRHYRADYTVMFSHSGGQVVRAVTERDRFLQKAGARTAALAASYGFAEDPRARAVAASITNQLGMIIKSRISRMSADPNSVLVEPYFGNLKKLKTAAEAVGSQLRLLWLGHGVTRRAWSNRSDPNQNWATSALSPLTLQVGMSAEQFEQSLANGGVEYRLVQAPEAFFEDEVPGEEIMRRIANAAATALFAREGGQ